MVNLFQQNGYEFIPGLLDPLPLFKYMSVLNEKGFGHTDTQVAGSKVFYKEPIFEKLLDNIKPVIEEQSGCSLFKTYSFARMYELGSVLRSHTDRESCEITVTIALGHQGAAWPICLEGRDGQTQAFVLQPGDALMFKGIELLHWRNENVFGSCSQLFLHYVDEHGPYACFKDDNVSTAKENHTA